MRSQAASDHLCAPQMDDADEERGVWTRSAFIEPIPGGYLKGRWDERQRDTTAASWSKAAATAADMAAASTSGEPAQVVVVRISCSSWKTYPTPAAVF